MIMVLLVYQLVLAIETCRFVKYFCDEQGIKVPEQIMDDYNEAEGEFGNDPESFDFIFHNGGEMDIFQYKIGVELVASVFLVRRTFYMIVDEEPVGRSVVLLYTMYVSKKYRGKGYSKRILKDALDSLNSHYGMNGDFLVVLHLDPKDRDMALAFSLYYNLNFRNGGFSMTGPGEKQYFLEEILEYRDPCDAVDKYNEKRDKGLHMIMFCEYSKLFTCKKIPYERLMEYGSRLKSILRSNKPVETQSMS
ncbi:uncharacterized protein Eint_081350 [Encephalitozoon intestinalis ATCC 50506]|uniref:N-acetyltransferase domain-containing protein n=1 Tax=Encephalitozoon intestinalis (strain ATCC 50506) TaxID=876142 RepID=E0S8C9_ENCIT|nr:uncharacterized protein Eint_081350 [Encephalitozoon intestinalis ATCC 50506]ADM12067.1 hypothetical protein Eint_081350 [Encephalitozoon intestinalis ATCC 50506]UTX45857.1 putative acetyl-transferase [Encephalitozoon intestinalis]